MESPGMSGNSAPKTVVTCLRMPEDITEQNPALTNRLECLVTPRRKQSAAKNHRTVTDWNPALSSLRAALFAVVVVVVVAFCPLPLANASLVSQLSFPPFLRCCDCATRVLVGGFGWGFV